MALLIIKEEKQPSRDHRLLQRAVIGRTSDCDIAIKDGHSSRRHAVVYRHGSEYFVRDLDTRNGTQVNGENITTRRLRSGDDVRIGLTRIVLRLDPGEDQSGASFAGMEILERVGAGAASTVYRARQRNLGRLVALKTYPVAEGEDTDHWLRSFGVAALDHPNIARVHDAGVEGGQKYLVMEFVRGTNLAARLRSEGRLSPAECLSIMSQTAQALAHAHNNGVIHANLRPSKIYVQPDGTVKVVDFGLPAPQLPKRGEAAQANVNAVYVSPEQCLGEPPGPSSDIYALGAIFYRIITGHPLFQGTDANDIIQRQILQSPVPPRDLVPDLPEAIASVLNRMLAKNPAERYASGAELADAVMPMVGPAAAAAPGAAEPAPARPAPRERPGPLIGGSPAMALIAGFLLVVALYALFLGSREMGHQAVWLKERIINLWEGEPRDEFAP
jgi:hypothetical protein